jgi:GntR family transcriptional regulator / MocR family aminotransferase
MPRRYAQTGSAIRSNSVSVEWTGLGPELLVRLNRTSGEPLHSQLERELREAVRTRRLHPGERLPSSRALAAELGLSRGLVLESYRQLQAEGYLTTKPGSATRVAAGAQVPSARPGRTAVSPRLAVDFLPNLPDLTSFPRRDWAWALREACTRASASELGYGDPRGSQLLREVLAAYAGRVRAAVTDPDQIVVCAGFAQGLNLVLRALVRRGLRQVAIEDPGDLFNSDVSRRTGVETVPVSIDEKGIVVEALHTTEARAVVVTAAHQSPSGVVLAPERRHALLAWASERGATIIEDDYDAEFRYDREPVGSIQGLAPERVAIIGTVSKALAPAIRLGWIVCPQGLVEAVAHEKHLSDRGSPGLDQVALAVLIESGRYDRHIRRMRAVYARRRDALVQALTRYAPDVTVHGLAAGFQAVAHLPEGSDEEAIVAAARERSIGLYGMSGFRASGAPRPPQLVLGFGNLSAESIEHGISVIGDLLGRKPTRRAQTQPLARADF